MRIRFEQRIDETSQFRKRWIVWSKIDFRATVDELNPTVCKQIPALDLTSFRLFFLFFQNVFFSSYGIWQISVKLFCPEIFSLLAGFCSLFRHITKKPFSSTDSFRNLVALSLLFNVKYL